MLNLLKKTTQSTVFAFAWLRLFIMIKCDYKELTKYINKVSETFSDRKFYLKHKLSTASLQSSTGKVIINYSTDIATGQWFTITTIMTCNITRISFAYVNSQCNEYTMDINYVYDLFFSNKNLYCSGKCCALLSELAVVAVCQDSSVALCR